VPRSEPAPARRRLPVAGRVVVLLLVPVALAGILLLTHRLSEEERRLLDEAPAAAEAAACTPVQTVPAYPGGFDRAHVGGRDLPTIPPLDEYPSVPPVSGPHGGATFGAGIYSSPPPLDLAIHSLEHGAVVVWFDPGSAAEPELEVIRRFFQESGEGGHVIVAPYDYPAEGDAGTLPDGSQMALAAWHHLQLCDRLSLPVAFQFVEAYRFNLYRWGSYQGDAPEKFAPI
jgi:hypothetical protein